MGNNNSARKNVSSGSRPESITGYSPHVQDYFHKPLNSSNMSNANSPNKHKSVSTGLLLSQQQHNGRDIIMPVNDMFVVVSAPTTSTHNNPLQKQISSQSKMIPTSQQHHHHHSHAHVHHKKNKKVKISSLLKKKSSKKKENNQNVHHQHHQQEQQVVQQGNDIVHQRGKSPRKKKMITIDVPSSSVTFPNSNNSGVVEHCTSNSSGRGRAVSATPTTYHSSSMTATTFNNTATCVSTSHHENEMATMSDCCSYDEDGVDCSSEVIGHFDEDNHSCTNSADFEEQSSSFRRLSLMETCDDDIMFDSMMYNQSHYYSSFTNHVVVGKSSYYSNYDEDDTPSAPTSLTPSNYSSSSKGFGANSLSSVNNSHSSLNMIGQCARVLKSNVNSNSNINSNQEMRPKSSGSLPTVNALSRQSYNDQSIAALKDLINVNIGV